MYDWFATRNLTWDCLRRLGLSSRKKNSTNVLVFYADVNSVGIKFKMQDFLDYRGSETKFTICDAIKTFAIYLLTYIW